MERFWLSFLWSFLSSLLVPETMSTEVLFNSTLACTRGANQTNQVLDCRNGPIKGLVGKMFISRIFVGTPPITSGCDRTAPYSNCCTRNPQTDCVFATDNGLKEIVEKYSGAANADFTGLRMTIPPEKCDPKIYPDLTSYSFIELGCASVTLLNDITANGKSKLTGEVYMDSNNYFSNTKVNDDDFQCVAETECNSTVTFVALSLRRKVDSFGHCPEKFVFEDLKYSNVYGNITCDDGGFIFNKPLFTSVSNIASFNMTVKGNHTGKVFFKAMSSKEAATVSLSCGTEARNAMDNIKYCPDDRNLHEPSTVVSNTTEFAILTMKTNPQITNTFDNNGLSTGTIVGIVLAVIAIILVLALIIGMVVHKLRKNRKDNTPRNEEDFKSSDFDEPPPYHAAEQNNMDLSQVDAERVHHLGGTYLRVTNGSLGSTVGTATGPPDYEEPSNVYGEHDPEPGEWQNGCPPPNPCNPVSPDNPNYLSLINSGFNTC